MGKTNKVNLGDEKEKILKMIKRFLKDNNFYYHLRKRKSEFKYFSDLKPDLFNSKTCGDMFVSLIWYTIYISTTNKNHNDAIYASTFVIDFLQNLKEHYNGRVLTNSDLNSFIGKEVSYIEEKIAADFEEITQERTIKRLEEIKNASYKIEKIIKLLKEAPEA